MYPLSQGQRALWFLYQLAPYTAAYHIAFAAGIVSEVDLVAMRRAFQELAERHPALRATYGLRDGQPCQSILEDAKLAFTHVHAEGWDEARLARQAHERYAEPFDLANGPVFRVHLFTRGGKDHLLLFTVHHIACDGPCLRMLIQEFHELYRAAVTGTQAHLPPLRNTYADYVERESEMLQGEEGDSLLDFWRKRLAGELPNLNLPSDRPRPPVQSFRGASHKFALAPEIHRRLEDLAREQGTSLYVLLLAAYQTLLMRHTSQEDILVGTPVTVRAKADIGPVAGYFLNAVVVRGDLSGNPTFQEFLARTHKTAEEAFQRRDYPFPLIVEKIHPARDPSRSPIFQTMFSLVEEPCGAPAEGPRRGKQEDERASAKPGELTLKPFPLDQEEGQFDLTLELRRSGDALDGVLRYNTDLFDAESIVRIAERFLLLLNGILDNPAQRVKSLPVVTETERGQLAEWNSARADYSGSVCLHHLFEAQVERTPDAPAVVFDDRVLTYSALNARANILARRLRGLGVGPDCLAGIYVERSMEMVVALLAVLKAGGAYVPLDPEYPRERLTFMIQDAGMRVLLALEGHKPDIAPLSGTKLVLVDHAGDNASAADTGNLGGGAAPENLAYVIYTSGSTGAPKGVMIPHGAICNHMLWMRDEYPLAPSDSVLQKTPISFDASVWEFHAPLLAGAKLVMARPEGHRDTAYLVGAIVRHGITTLQLVPSLLRVLLENRDFATCRSLRRVFCGGEVLTPELVSAFRAVSDAELINLYGPTECTIDATHYLCPREDSRAGVPIGRAVANVQAHILDANLAPLSVGAVGDLYIGGAQVARGYLNRPDLTAERFIPDPLAGQPGARLYKTGDVARWRNDGNIEFLGRGDHQVKIRGFRIELGEIESALEKHPCVRQAVVMTREDEPGNARLAAYLLAEEGTKTASADLRRHLRETLPEYMIPSVFMTLKEMPKTPSGKIDRRALPEPEAARPELEGAMVLPRNQMEKTLAGIWSRILNLDRVGTRDSFFDLGGNSLLAYRAVSEIQRALGKELPVVKIFQYPTINALARFLSEGQQDEPFLRRIQERARRRKTAGLPCGESEDAVAVIGMAGRFPGADNIEDFWKNLCGGVETVTFFPRDELGPGIEESVLNDPDYVPARGIINDIDKFDAAFFGIRPREAEVMAPQQRVLLETAWAALEHAGYDASRFDGLIGVFAGMGNNTYFRNNVAAHPEVMRFLGDFQVQVGNEKDHIAPRISYLMNLTGPSLSVHTACSTSLVVIDNAFHSLLTGQCDIALAGGVDITVPQKSGQLYQDGGVFTRDGHCRPFDAGATGTMFGEGSGVVVLRRLKDALGAGDTIHAIIRGTAINHDGSNKVSYLAPGVDGQAEVVAAALIRANVHADTVTYVEAHGTGTPVGDPIEVEALTKAFRAWTQRKQYCAIGSIKGNMGHCTIAAGVVGLIKVALCLRHKTLVPQVNYDKPNPEIDFENSPFYVNTELREWPAGPAPRRAGISSFGFCGTNAHAVLEEAPPAEPSGPSRARQLLLLSAKTEAALNRATSALEDHFVRHPETNLADAAYTLQTGRRAFVQRRFVVCRDAHEAAAALESLDPTLAASRSCESSEPEVVFMFPGQGAQYVNMGISLYRDEPVFRDAVDRCAEILKPHLGRDLRELLYPAEGDNETAAESLKETYFTQPAIFTIEYALSKLWESWGVKPRAMIGHSIGEFVCGCLAEVISLEDALLLVAMRGRLMQGLPGGAMISVRMPAGDLEKRLGTNLSIAAVNGPSLCVMSGPTEEAAELQRQLESEGVICRPLHTSHAFHSPMMDPIVEPFAEFVRGVALSPPKIPFVSTVTTRWITGRETTDPMYWARHLRATVRFAEGIQELWKDPARVLLEVGPRTTATTLARQQAKDMKKQVAIPSLSDTHENETEWTSLLKAVGQLWLSGASINWTGFYAREKRRRIPLPTYSFERTRYWLEPAFTTSLSASLSGLGTDPAAPPMEARAAAVPGPEEGTPGVPKTRRERLVPILRKLLQETSGMDLSSADESTTYLEMGLDSLFLTQIARRLHKEFGARITFRQMLEEYPTLKKTAEFLDKQMPPDAPAEETGSLRLEVAGTETREPTAYSLQPTASSLQPTASSLKPQAYSLEQEVARQTEIISQLAGMLEERGVALPPEMREAIQKEKLAREPTPEKPRAERQEKGLKPALRTGERVPPSPAARPAAFPPVPGARLGRDPEGNPAWYMPDPSRPGKYLKVGDTL